MLTAALSLFVATIAVPTLGFTVERAGDELPVASVSEGSAAAKGELRVGDVITRVTLPVRPALRRPFSQLNDEDVALVLTPPVGEKLVLSVRRGEAVSTRVLERTDAAPADPFAEVPLPPEKLQRLTALEQARYFAVLAERQRQRAPRPEPVPAPEPARPRALKRSLDGLRVEPERLVVGSAGTLEARLAWEVFTPRPTKVRVLLLSGGAERFLGEASPGRRAETKLTLEVPTAAPGTLELVAEARFADGTTGRGPPQRVQVRAKEEAEREEAQAKKAFADFEAVQERLKAKYPDPCAQREAVVAWLKQQPEVSHASVNGTDFSYVIDFIPVAFHCH